MTDSHRPPPPPVPSPGVPAAPPASGRGCWFYGCLVTGVLLLVVVLTAAVTAWQVKRSLAAPPITPVELTADEQATLEEKIQVLGRGPGAADDPREQPAGPVGGEAAPVDEAFVRRPLVITEREINGLIANNTDLGDKVSIRLDDGALKLAVNYPVEPGTPFLGGKTIRLNIRTRIALEGGRLEVRVTNVALGGLPVPSAWLGGLTQRNLVAEFAGDNEAMEAIVAGIESLEIDDGRLVFMPAE